MVPILFVGMLFWHGDDNVEDPSHYEETPLRENDVMVKAFWCKCGLGVDVTLFPSLGDASGHDHIYALDVAFKSKFNTSTRRRLTNMSISL